MSGPTSEVGQRGATTIEHRAFEALKCVWVLQSGGGEFRRRRQLALGLLVWNLTLDTD
jgi:hypothetical protein